MNDEYEYAEKSLKALFDHFGLSLNSFSLGGVFEGYSRPLYFVDEGLFGESAKKWVDERVSRENECAFTGHFYDDLLLRFLDASISQGMTLREAFSTLGKWLGRFFDAEEEALRENVADYYQMNNYMFDERGEIQ